MRPTTIIIGILLALLGVRGCISTEGDRMGAFSPALIGVPIALLGVLALSASWRKHAMHVAAMFGLVGVVLGLRGFLLWVLGKNPYAMSALVQLTMTLLCAVFVGLCVVSFIRARRQRREEMPAAN